VVRVAADAGDNVCLAALGGVDGGNAEVWILKACELPAPFGHALFLELVQLLLGAYQACRDCLIYEHLELVFKFQKVMMATILPWARMQCRGQHMKPVNWRMLQCFLALLGSVLVSG
jgi:hypothetical protein